MLAFVISTIITFSFRRCGLSPFAMAIVFRGIHGTSARTALLLDRIFYLSKIRILVLGTGMPHDGFSNGKHIPMEGERYGGRERRGRD